MSRPTVLYVEDEADDVLFMQVAFRRAALPADLRAVEDGLRAIGYLAGEGRYGDRGRHPLPTLILLDLNLPLRSGFEVLQWLREQPAFAQLRVIIFSSSGRPEDRTRAQELGVTDYVLKPSSGLEFEQVARQIKERWLLPATGPVVSI